MGSARKFNEQELPVMAVWLSVAFTMYNGLSNFLHQALLKHGMIFEQHCGNPFDSIRRGCSNVEMADRNVMGSPAVLIVRVSAS